MIKDYSSKCLPAAKRVYRSLASRLYPIFLSYLKTMIQSLQQMYFTTFFFIHRDTNTLQAIAGPLTKEFHYVAKVCSTSLSDNRVVSLPSDCLRHSLYSKRTSYWVFDALFTIHFPLLLLCFPPWWLPLKRNGKNIKMVHKVYSLLLFR